MHTHILNISGSREHRSRKFSGRIYEKILDFPDSPVVKNLPVDEGDSGSILIQEDPACLLGTKPVRRNS